MNLQRRRYRLFPQRHCNGLNSKPHSVSDRRGSVGQPFPMKIRSLVLFFVLLAGGTTSVHADITLAPLFRDGAVLQRDQPLTVWGRAAAAEKVEVKFRRQTASVITAADGRWRVTLKPERATTGGSELVATGANTVVIRDVLVGDVWLCS